MKVLNILKKAVSALALRAGITALNTACVTVYHQPEIPESLNRFRK